jgi:hypothetical protein
MHKNVSFLPLWAGGGGGSGGVGVKLVSCTVFHSKKHQILASSKIQVFNFIQILVKIIINFAPKVNQRQIID